ncbi:MAG: histidine phosphatase family protein [Thalassobaculales bacterium]
MGRTDWFWIRHAPVTSDGGRVYGAKDMPADCSDAETFAWLSRLLPREAVWVTSALMRTRQTVEAVIAAGYPANGPALVEPGLGEQHLGAMQGLVRHEAYATHSPGRHRLWLSGVDVPAPGGESFRDLIGRVTPVVERLTAAHAGRPIVCVAHGGSIRAALTLAGVAPEAALAMEIENLSVTRMSYLPPAGQWPAIWQVGFVNRLPR